MLAINQKIRRLPGFHFEAAAPPREDVLPRMDVALFVGFAATGPIGIPVAVESAQQFQTIFGNDLPLVWDAEKGAGINAFLAPTIRSFFRNGGKRCWILRVARLESTRENPLNRASRNFFPLAGLACVNFDKNQIKNIAPVFARTRSKGSWSDDLQIGTAILSKSFRLSNLEDKDVNKIISLEIGVNETISNGDLFRLTFGDEYLVLLAAVDEVLFDDEKNQVPPQPNSTPSFGKRIIRFTSKRFIWLNNSFLNSPSAPVEDIWVRLWTLENELATANFLPIRLAKLEFRQEKNKSKIKLEFYDLSAAEAPSSGSLLITKFQDKPLCLQVETVNVNSFDGQESVEVLCRAAFCLENSSQPNSIPTVERLTFEIWSKKEAKSLIKLGDLAFNDEHERFWGNLPTDEDLYSFTETGKKIPAWTQNSEAAIFPLAGSGSGEDFCFPIFVAAFAENFLGAIPLSGTKLQREGLEVFDEDLFLDRKLKNTGASSLLNEAEFIRYLSLQPRSLWGIHCALVPETSERNAPENLKTNPLPANYSLDECTIIAVPDALHRGWAKTGERAEILSPPVFSPPLRPEWWHFQDCRKSEGKKVKEPLWGNFLDCGIRFVKAPENLQITGENFASGKFRIEWICAENGEDLEFVLEESASAKFDFAAEIYHGAAKHFEIAGRGAGIYYYRVRAEIGENFSDWSVGLAVKIPPSESFAANLLKDFNLDVLFAVQRGILRMCAARGDVFAVLNLPEHFDETECFSHLATLRTTKGFAPATNGVEPFSADETKVLSYGAAYHPWLLTHEDDFSEFRNIPPDGAIVGAMARRSNERGVWVSPANEKLQGVLGLAKEIKRDRFLDFQDNLINLVRQEPQGFLVLDSDTLSDDADLRSINVRRLLSLLRRLAIKHGAEYVFEPNDARFRRQVQRGFASLLDVMFVRGAFAGATPANSYQVVVSETLNNLQSLEQGHFIVELKIAPSLPLKFVTVRLINSGGRSSITEVF